VLDRTAPQRSQLMARLFLHNTFFLDLRSVAKEVMAERQGAAVQSYSITVWGWKNQAPKLD
jgi:hypothetical protein